MSFLTPWLLIGVAAVAIPVLIHLLSRYRHRRLEWAAMELLRRAVRVRTRRLRLEDLLLLALRSLIVLLIALALAQPTTRGWGFFGQPQVGMVVAVDGSMSMGHAHQGQRRFDRAADAAGQILATARTGDPTALMVMGARPHVMLRNIAYQPDRAQAALADLDARPQNLNLEAALEQASQLLGEMTAPNTELHIITDAQAATWANLSDRARGLIRSLAADHRLFLVPVRNEGANNVAITDLQLTSGALRVGELVRLTVRLENFSPAARTGLRVSLEADGRTVDRAIIDALQPGATAAIPFFLPLHQPGDLRLTAKITGDGLAWDDRRHLTLHVRKQVRVLVVDGDPFATAADGAAEFISRALAPNRADRPGTLHVTTRPWTGLPSIGPDEYDLVILANVPEVPAATVEQLHRFVEGGGGLIVYLGDKVQPDLLNRRLVRDGRPLLPALLKQVELHRYEHDAANRIDPDIPAHPIADVLAHFPVETVTGSRFVKHMQVDLAPAARVLVRFVDGDPLLIEHQLGLGKVLLFTSSADRSWNDLALNPIFPALLHQAVTHLLRQAHEQPARVARPMLWPLRDTPAGRGIEVTDPRGRTLTHVTELRAGQVVLDLAGLDVPGFYEVAIDDRAARPIAVNADTAESDIRASAPAELAAALGDLPVRVIEFGDNLGPTVRQARVGRELWKALLAAAGVALLIESVLAKRYARRTKG